MKKNTEKLIPTRKYHASPRLTHDFKQSLKKAIKWLFVNQEFIEFMDRTLKQLPHKDRLPCLYHFKAISVEVHRTPEPEHYKAYQDEYDDYLSAIADEQKNCDPVKWIDFKIEEITALGVLAYGNQEQLDDSSETATPAFDPELVPERKLIQMLGMSKSKLGQLRSEGLPFQKIGKPVFYNLNDVKQWLKRPAA